MRTPRFRVEPLEDRLAPSVAGSFDPSFGSGGVSPDLNGSVAAVTVDTLGRVGVV